MPLRTQARTRTHTPHTHTHTPHNTIHTHTTHTHHTPLTHTTHTPLTHTHKPHTHTHTTHHSHPPPHTHTHTQTQNEFFHFQYKKVRLNHNKISLYIHLLCCYFIVSDVWSTAVLGVRFYMDHSVFMHNSTTGSPQTPVTTYTPSFATPSNCRVIPHNKGTPKYRTCSEYEIINWSPADARPLLWRRELWNFSTFTLVFLCVSALWYEKPKLYMGWNILKL